jgi:hypothetical protein
MLFDASQCLSTEFSGYLHPEKFEIFNDLASIADVLARLAAVDLYQRHLQPALFASAG